jgi:hypothetical protein
VRWIDPGIHPAGCRLGMPGRSPFGDNWQCSLRRQWLTAELIQPGPLRIFSPVLFMLLAGAEVTKRNYLKKQVTFQVSWISHRTPGDIAEHFGRLSRNGAERLDATACCRATSTGCALANCRAERYNPQVLPLRRPDGRQKSHPRARCRRLRRHVRQVRRGLLPSADETRSRA